jgi:hypothetical protein
MLTTVPPLCEDRHLELRTLNSHSSCDLWSSYPHRSFIRAIFFSMADK